MTYGLGRVCCLTAVLQAPKTLSGFRFRRERGVVYTSGPSDMPGFSFRTGNYYIQLHHIGLAHFNHSICDVCTFCVDFAMNTILKLLRVKFMEEILNCN